MAKCNVMYLVISVAAALPNASSAQSFPSKPIRIVTAAAGGGSDFVARLIAPGLSAALGQPVVIENRGGILQGEIVSKSPPDGHTLLLSASVWTTPLMQETPFDPIRDFSPVTIAVSAPHILMVHPSLPVRSVRDLIALAKAKPGELNYSSTNVGTSPQLATELFKSMAGINIVAVPYNSSAQAQRDLIAGQTQVMFASAAGVLPQVKAGRVRALAVTSAQPSALVPGLPTIAASGLPGYQSAAMTALFTPAKTPGPVISRLNQEIVRTVLRPELREKFFSVGVEPIGSSPEELAAAIKSEMAIMSKVIKDAGIRPPQ